MTPQLLEAWDFLDGLICTGGHADSISAHQVLRIFPEIGEVERIRAGEDEVMYLDTGDPLDVTLWWRKSTQLFYLGVVGDDEGSLTR